MCDEGQGVVVLLLYRLALCVINHHSDYQFGVSDRAQIGSNSQLVKRVVV